MSKQQEALRLALEALEVATTPLARDRQEVLRAIAALREALAEQKSGIKQVIELYDSPDQPPQRTWVGLTDEERMDVLLALNWDKQLTHMDTAKAIEAKLKEKNNA